jgi:hypothetical protein
MLACARALGHECHMRYVLRLFLVSLGLAFGAGLTGCAQFPDLDAVQTPGVSEAPYPELLPLDALLGGAVPEVSGVAAARVERRVEALRGRADRLLRAELAQGGVDARLARLRQKAAELRRQ